MPLLLGIPLWGWLAGGVVAGTAYTANQVRGGIQDASRSPVAGVAAVAALGLVVYLILGRKR